MSLNSTANLQNVEDFSQSVEASRVDLEWNLDLTNLYIAKSSVGITKVILQPGLFKCMEKNLEITNQFP